MKEFQLLGRGTLTIKGNDQGQIIGGHMIIENLENIGGMFLLIFNLEKRHMVVILDQLELEKDTASFKAVLYGFIEILSSKIFTKDKKIRQQFPLEINFDIFEKRIAERH